MILLLTEQNLVSQILQICMLSDVQISQPAQEREQKCDLIW